MNNKNRIVQVVVFLFVIGILATFVMGLRAQGNAVGIGEEASDFELEDLAGDMHSLSEHRGQVVVLNFFATWCKPCEDEAPELVAFHEDFKDEVAYFSVVKAESKKAVQKFIDRTGFEKPYIFDFKLEVSNSFGIVGQPETIIIDQNGIIANHFVGGVTRDLLAEEVRKLD